MGKYLTLFFSILILNTSLQADVGWNLIKDEEGVQVFERNNPGTYLKTVKGVVVIPVPLNDLIDVLVDTQTFPRWLFKCIRASTLKQPSFVERYDHIITNMPWPVWDRDVIVRSVFQQNRATKQVEIKFSSAPDSLALKPGIVRIRKMSGRMLLTPLKKKSVQLIYEVSVDPGGRIPKWLVNDMAVDFPYYSLKNLRALIKEPLIKSDYF